MEHCDKNCGCEARIVNLEDDKQEQWRAIDGIRDKLDGMKNWLIGLLVTLLIQLTVSVGSYFVIAK